MFLPLLLKDGFSCLIAGGGQVAARKVKVLTEMPCSISIIAPQIEDSVYQKIQSGSIRWIQREFQAGDCRGFQLVIAATPKREVNRAVSDEAQAFGIPVNVVDDPSLSTVIFPAMSREKSLVIAVSTEGIAPFMASRIRTQLAACTSGLGEWVEVAGNFRAVVREEIIDPQKREELYRLFSEQTPPGRYERPSEKATLHDWLVWLDKLKKN
jgi:uroporphyrin-III C-methyltransferase/precorrin-2 dehydrogenase/sirohydrochlorin ferrochelatase